MDVVVTDKKGNYIQDLTTKDFRLYEDDKEQAINTFSFGAAPNGPIEAQRHYMVVFFDNSSMDLSDQPRARAAAAKFIDAYAGPDRVMAVMNFGGTLQIVQNFTTDAARLKQAVSGIANSNIATNASASNTSAPTMGLPQSSRLREPGRQCGRRFRSVHVAAFDPATGEKPGGDSGAEEFDFVYGGIRAESRALFGIDSDD